MDLEEESMHKPSALQQMHMEDLSDASIDELEKRILVLRDEIERVEGAIVSKKASQQAAESVFKT